MQNNSEADFMDLCLLQMGSADPIERAFGRLQRDCVTALNRTTDEKIKPGELIEVVANVISSLAVNATVRSSLPGNEQRVLQHILTQAGNFANNHLEAHLGAPGARGAMLADRDQTSGAQAGTQAGRISGAQQKDPA